MNIKQNIKTLIVEKPLKLDCGKTIKDPVISAAVTMGISDEDSTRISIDWCYGRVPAKV